MKKLAVLFLVWLSLASAAILVDGVDLADIDAHYIKLDFVLGWGNKIYTYVDYGQGGKYTKHKVIDENGKARAFKSKIEVLNTFYKNAWEVNSVITEPKGGADSSAVSGYTYYLLERRDEK